MPNVDLNKRIKEKIKALNAYHVENFDCAIKLHANENSFTPPAEIQDMFVETFRKFQLNRYPDPNSQKLRETLSRRLNLSPEHITIGNGSDELIQILIQIFCDPNDTVAYPDPTFAMYSIIARGMGLNTHTVSLNDHWDIDADTLLDELNKSGAQIVFLSYPNNPTGNCFSEGEVRKVIERFEGITVLDEAYYDFAQSTFLPMLKDHNNLVILRSLSKIGLAGLRVGFAVADPVIIEQINKVRLPYNSNTVSQTLAEQLLSHFEPVQKQIDVILEQRQWLEEKMKEISGLETFPSHSNFILFRVKDNSGEVFNQLVEKGILIRDLNSHPRLKNCLRVTVGTHEENVEFVTQIKSILDHT